MDETDFKFLKMVMTCLLIPLDNENGDDNNNKKKRDDNNKKNNKKKDKIDESFNGLNYKNRYNDFEDKIKAKNQIRSSFLLILNYWLHAAFPIRVGHKLYPTLTDDFIINLVYVEGINILTEKIVTNLFYDINTIIFEPIVPPLNGDDEFDMDCEANVPTNNGI